MDLATPTADLARGRPARKISVAYDPSPGVGAAASKRLFDLCVALALLLFFAPLMLAIAVMVKATSEGPALFKQRRTGLGGRVFVIYKFRSMTVMEDGEVTAARRGDPRLTSLGAVLRRSSLDELPQLLNVIKGDMSLVGPRPHAVAHDELFGSIVPEYAHRFRARPGLTGLAQVNGHRGGVNTLEGLRARVAADNSYIAQWSLALDVQILAATGVRIWQDERAY
jgi:putative colanic acid biosynthesis UDP-glucose lipid carrier transferase